MRLVAVLGVLVGLTILQSSPCADQLRVFGHDALCSTTATIAPSSDTADSPVSALIGELESAAHQVGVGLLAPLSAPDAPAGVVGLCLALLVAVLLVVIGLARPSLPQAAPVRAGPRSSTMQRHRRGPALAMLCVLRT